MTTLDINKPTPAQGKAKSTPRRENPLMVNSVRKAFSVLELFGQSHRKLTLTQIAAAASLDLSTAQRFVNSLMSLGYLAKDPASRMYFLTARVLELGYHYLQSSDLVERATPYVQRLSVDTEETVNLSILDGTDIVLVARLVSRHVLRPEVTVGARLPACLTASGYALMSALPDEALRDLIRQADFHAEGPIDPDAIVERCRQVSEKGYSFVADGFFPNDITIAAPIFDARGEPHAALSIAVSKLRWTADRAEAELTPRLLDAAQPISIVRVRPHRGV